MHTTNYNDTLITPAADCPAPAAVIPAKPGSVAALQFDLLSAAPFALTSDDVLWQVACARKGTDPADATARDAFFAKPQACLRASPLVKTHGWALRHDAQGRVALVDPGTADYAAAVADPGLTKRPGMRNARAYSGSPSI